jgi:hypothetical protein
MGIRFPIPKKGTANVGNPSNQAHGRGDKPAGDGEWSRPEELTAPRKALSVMAREWALDGLWRI